MGEVEDEAIENEREEGDEDKEGGEDEDVD